LVTIVFRVFALDQSFRFPVRLAGFHEQGVPAMTRASDLPSSFRHVRLVLARESGHPEGTVEEGYDLLLPLDSERRIDAGLWKANAEHCRVRSFGKGPDRIGRLRRKPGGQYYLDYADGEQDDEAGFRLGEEKFVPGEYVSIRQADGMHTYRVARVEKP
jgi:hypothetical protein